MGDGRYLIRAEVLVMKKLISMFLVLAMLLGCVAFAEGVDYTGTWVVTGMEADGIQMGTDMLTLLGISMTITLNMDGKAVLTVNDVAENGTWSLTENGVAITDEDGETKMAAYRDEMLVIEEDGAAMMLTREGAAPAVAAKETATVLTGVDPAAVEGSWVLTNIVFMDIEMPAESMGLYMEFVLAGGGGTFIAREDEGETMNMPVTYSISEVEGVGSVLVLNAVNVENGLVEELLTLNVMSNDTLRFAMEEDGLTIAYTFARKAE